jgi:hypothetical protein
MLKTILAFKLLYATTSLGHDMAEGEQCPSSAFSNPKFKLANVQVRAPAHMNSKRAGDCLG